MYGMFYLYSIRFTEATKHNFPRRISMESFLLETLTYHKTISQA